MMKQALALTALTLTASLMMGAAHAGPTLDPIFTFENPEPADGDRFGEGAALSDEYIVIGASRDDASGRDDGRAYVYDARTGTLLHTLANPTPTDRDLFGFSAAIENDQVVIGAVNSDATGTVNGRAYAFDLVSGGLIRAIDNPTAGSGAFGVDVALDGGRALIGAFAQEIAGNSAQGRAHLIDVATGAVLRSFNDPTPTSADRFGEKVSLFGNLALIGANGDDTNGTNAGQAYLFDTNTGALLHIFNDPTPNAGDGFGFDVHLGDGFALVGAFSDDSSGLNQGRAFLFDTSTGDLLRIFEDPTPTDRDLFGFNLAVDGDFILSSAVNDDTLGPDVGQVHLFRASTGELLHTFDNPSPGAVDQFGRSVAISGNRVLIGTGADDTTGIDSGRAYLYDISSIVDGTSTPVPLPATLAFLGLGLLSLGLGRRWSGWAKEGGERK